MLSWWDELLWVNVLRELSVNAKVWINGKWDVFVAVIIFVTVIRTPHRDPPLTGFWGLQQVYASLIKKHKNPYLIFHYYEVSK